MKQLFTALVTLSLALGIMVPSSVYAYNYGDYRSETLATKAWQALAEGDMDAVMAYTNKNIELYAAQAKKMQQDLDDFVTESNDKIFSKWALNDIATSYFIQGEAYRKMGKMDEAVKAYKKIIDEYSFGQTWDTGGWFWKPAEAAKEKIAMIESGSDLDFGNYSSETLTVKAWEALNKGDFDAVMIYTNKVLELYENKAREMQESLTEYPWESKEEIFSYWALNDVGASLFIQGEALRQDGKTKEAKKVFEKLVSDYYFSQCWDPKGWFWKPAEAAQQKLDDLEEI